MSTAAVSSERSVLAQVSTDPSLIYQVRNILKPEDFTVHPYRSIYALMVTLSMRPRAPIEGEAKKPFDTEILFEHFSSMPDAESLQLQTSYTEIVSSLSLSGTLGAHIDIILRRSYRRGLIEKADQIAQLARSEAEEEVIEEKVLSYYSTMRRSTSSKPIMDPGQRMIVLEEYVRNRQEGRTVDIHTGYLKLDAALGGGLIRGTFNILTAQTGGFKSTMALSAARRMAHYYGYKVLVVSVEMPDIILSQKDVSAVTGIELDKMRVKAGLSEEERASIGKAIGFLGHSNYYSWAYSGTVGDIQSICQEMVLAIGLDVVIVDYLQILTPTASGNLYQQVTEFSSQLRRMAKDLNVVVWCLAQMHRGIFGSPEMLPEMNMLKDSGSIENDSASIIGLYWPWAVASIPGHYVPEEHKPYQEAVWRSIGANRPPTLDSYRSLAVPTTHELQAIVLKNRMGQGRQLVRLGVAPGFHDVFDPFVGQQEHERRMLEALNQPIQGSLSGISVRAGWTEDSWLEKLVSSPTLLYDGDLSRRAIVGGDYGDGNLGEDAMANLDYQGLV